MMDRVIADRIYTLITIMEENNKLLKEMVKSNKEITRALNSDNTRRK